MNDEERWDGCLAHIPPPVWWVPGQALCLLRRLWNTTHQILEWILDPGVRVYKPVNKCSTTVQFHRDNQTEEEEKEEEKVEGIQ